MTGLVDVVLRGLGLAVQAIAIGGVAFVPARLSAWSLVLVGALLLLYRES